MTVYSKNIIAARNILHFLVEAGADLNAKNHDQWTPLHLAVKKGCLEAIEGLLSLRKPTYNLDLDL